ncbi:MAG: hypothetical protein Q8L60_09280 [Gammaproteobacteria bacterium]|nr:hypothetical protein [Gammaproteobacteria bacterium]MDP2347438.1 hypothetical protein [Gammaproteobacteria bacterium]
MNKIPWGPIRSSLATDFSFSDIKVIAGYADLDMSKLSHLEQKYQGGATKSQLLSAIDEQVGRMEDDQRSHVASICCEEMLRLKPAKINELERILSRVGWKFSGTTLLPVEIFDIAELQDIPELAKEDILKAASRLRDGDLSGSLSASCGALDTVTASIYNDYNLGDPTKASFQERIKRSVDTVGAKAALIQELQQIGWGDPDIKPLTSNLDGALNQAAFVMQKLRSDMGDVHGTKPVVSALVYDSIKWSLLLLRVLGCH